MHMFHIQCKETTLAYRKHVALLRFHMDLCGEHMQISPPIEILLLSTIGLGDTVWRHLLHDITHRMWGCVVCWNTAFPVLLPPCVFVVGTTHASPFHLKTITYRSGMI